MRGLVLVCVCLSFGSFAQGVGLLPDSKSVTLKERETTSVGLTIASCSPSPPSTLCIVSLANVYPRNPCSNCFALYPCNVDQFCLRFLAGQGSLNPSIVSRYSLTLRAADDSSEAAAVVDVHVQPNSPPYFDPDDFPNNQLHVTETLSSSGSVQVQAQDLDGDALTYSMTTVPSVDSIQIDSLSGTITATKDLRYECREFVTALVYVQDANHNDFSAPLAVTLNFAEANDRPIINNLNTDVYVREDEGVGQVVLPLAAYDGKTYPPSLTYTFSAVPSSAANLFEISGNDLLVNSPLDYETYPDGVTLNIRASDGHCDSDNYFLNVKLVDINEPPTLLPIDQTVESCEGLVDIRPVWSNKSDPDIGDVIRFTDIQPNVNGRFKINEETGVVSTIIDYDLDEDKLASTVVNEVTLSDRQGETATATLTVRFRDCNDNAPVYVIPAKEYMVRDCWSAGTVVGTVPRTEDADSSFQQNNVFSHSGSGPGAQVQESGSIVILEQFKAGQTVTFPVYATDQGQEPGPLTSKAFWVSLYTLPCIETDPVTVTSAVTTAGPTDNDIDFWSSGGPNLGWVIMALLLASLLLALSIYLLWRYWDRIKNCCVRRRPCFPKKEKPRRPITPTRKPTPPPERPVPGFIFGWWKETYPNNDYERQPNRHAIPEPNKGPELVDTNTYDPVPEIPPTPPTVPAAPRNSCCRIL